MTNSPERPGYSAEQRRSLEEAMRAEAALACPVCSTPLDRRAVPPRPDVSYVRDRVLLTCPRCQRTAVLDRKLPT